MRNRVFAFRYRILGQAAIVAALAGASAACSDDAARLREPFFTGSTANQHQILGDDQPMPPAIPGSAAISRNDLPPPPNVVASTGPLSAPTPSPAAVRLANAGAYGWTAVGGTVVTVGPGESLDTLSIRYGVPAIEIAKANQISSPADVKAGRSLVIPIRTALLESSPAERAPMTPATPKAMPAVAALKAGGGTYVVQSGQTLYSIAREHNLRVQDIATLNDIPPASAIRVGQELKLPKGAVAGATPVPAKAVAAVEAPKVLGAPPKLLGTLTEKKVMASLEPKKSLIPPAASVTPPSVPAVVAKRTDIPAVPDVPAAPDTKTAPPTVALATPAVDNSVDTASASGTAFRWPVRGRIISSFGTKPNGERNDGINLAVPEGTSVKAAEAGTVIYAGNELEGYGNLVLIRHADGWVSAYAHNNSILVKRGDAVRRGQNIAVAGMSGSVKTPQVHFELRKGSKPVNPLDYLAGA